MVTLSRLIPVFFAILVCSCKEKEVIVDVSHEHAKYPFLKDSYVVGGVYQTQKPFIARKDGSLVEPGGWMPFIEDIENDPGQHPDIEGIVPVNSTLRITRLEFRSRGRVYPYGVLLEGNLSGTELFLQGVSSFKHGTPLGTICIPDPTRLKLVEDAAQGPEGESK